MVITSIHNRKGNLTAFAKVTRDLTERRRAEEVLRASEEQFRLLLERVEEYAIYLLDPSGRVASWNSGAEKIKQFSASDIIGKHFACFYAAEDVAAGKPQQNLERPPARSYSRSGNARAKGWEHLLRRRRHHSLS